MSESSTGSTPEETATPSTILPQARKVKIVWRIPVGILIALFLGLLFFVVPWVVIPFLLMYGVHPASNIVVLAALGSIFALFEGARFVAKPTLYYGPLWTVSSAAFLAYVLYLAAGASITLTFISNVNIVVGYSLLLLFLALIPALTLGAAIVITIQDQRHPGERLPFDFPVRRWGRKQKPAA